MNDSFLHRIGALTLAASIALGPVIALPAPAAAAGPPSVADLSGSLIDSVVNVSTSQSVGGGDDDEDGPKAQPVPPGTPFEDFFNDFFQKRKGDNRPRKTSSLGSGFVIDPAGIIVTNNHVIDGADIIEVNFNDGSKLRAKLLGRDKKVDLAVLQVQPTKPLKAVKFADSSRIRVGDWALAIGNPFGLGGTVTLGIISALDRNIDSGPYDNYLQTDAAINRGNSGGPLFNMDGEVVGINTAIISPTGGSIGIGFSVPSATALPIIQQLREFGETRRGWLGVRIQIVTDEIAGSLKLDKAGGALVAGVDDKGPAKPAGIEPGDVILEFDGRPVRQMRDLPRIVADTPADKTVDVVIFRKGARMTRQVKVARLDETDKPTQQASLERELKPDEALKSTKVLGLEMSSISNELRTRYKLSKETKGVVITGVDSGSSADDKQVRPGDVIVQIGQQVVSTPEDVARRLAELRKSGTKQALLLLSNGNGEIRFVAVPVD